MYEGRRIPIDIHIGVEKTGTTTIQRYLRENRFSILAQHGTLFPRSLGGNLSANLAAACQKSAFPDDLRKCRNLLTADAVTNYRTLLQEQFYKELSQTNNLQRIVISCEHFSSRLKQVEEVQTLRDFLQPFSDDIRIIVYLRRQDEFFISAYSTGVKSGRTAPFQFPLSNNNSHVLYYSKLLERWTAVFGEKAIQVRLFERSRLKQADIIQDFCETLDLPANLPRSNEHENASFNTNMLVFLREFNHLVPRFLDNKYNKLRGNIIAALGELDLPGEKFKGNNDNERFYDLFKEDNNAVAKRWFKDDPNVPTSLFFGEAINPEQNISQDFDQHQLIQLCAGLWCYSQHELIAAQDKDNQKPQECLSELHASRESLRAELMMERGEHKAAAALLQTLVEKYPEHPRPRLLLDKLTRVKKSFFSKWIKFFKPTSY